MVEMLCDERQSGSGYYKGSVRQCWLDGSRLHNALTNSVARFGNSYRNLGGSPREFGSVRNESVISLHIVKRKDFGPG